MGVYSQMHMYSEKISKCASAHQPCPLAAFQTIYLFLHLFNKGLVPCACQTLWTWKKTSQTWSLPLQDLYIKGDIDDEYIQIN